MFLRAYARNLEPKLITRRGERGLRAVGGGKREGPE